VLGRKITYTIEDDQYDPAQTVALTQKLPLGKTYHVRYEHGFWNVLGTPIKTS
jgi:hypothetical protein